MFRLVRFLAAITAIVGCIAMFAGSAGAENVRDISNVNVYLRLNVPTSTRAKLWGLRTHVQVKQGAKWVEANAWQHSSLRVSHGKVFADLKSGEDFVLGTAIYVAKDGDIKGTTWHGKNSVALTLKVMHRSYKLRYLEAGLNSPALTKLYQTPPAIDTPVPVTAVICSDVLTVSVGVAPAQPVGECPDVQYVQCMVWTDNGTTFHEALGADDAVVSWQTEGSGSDFTGYALMYYGPSDQDAKDCTPPESYTVSAAAS